MVTALIVGAVVGFVLAIPPGPIAVACIKQTLEGNIRGALKMGFGASAMDILYALVAAFASSALFSTLKGAVDGNGWYMLAFQLICIAVLIFLGIRYFRPQTVDVKANEERELAQEERARKMGYSSPFLVGMLIALTNLASPTFLPSLIFAISILHSRNLVDHDISDNVMLAVGFGIGAALWFVVLLKGLDKLRSRLEANFIQIIYRIAGGSFIFFALLLAYKVVAATEWSKLAR